MRSILGSLAFVVLVLSLPAHARAGEVVVHLKSGSDLRGVVTRQDAQEIEIRLGDGMKMRIRRALIVRIEECENTPPDSGGDRSDPTPSPGQPSPAPPASGESETDRPLPIAGDPKFFEKAPGVDWDIRFGRHPVITAAKITRFRAYEYVEHSPLAVSPTDNRFSDVINRHGHGGSLSVWKFQYVGNLELRYGDEVKFVAELTSPADDNMLVLRLKDGPTPYAERLSVFLRRRGNEVRRFATTSVFQARDFKQSDLAALARKPMPVRTYSHSFIPVARTWLTPKESEFLTEIQSPFGNSMRIRLERYVFRLGWFTEDPGSRPDLDPDLIRRNAVRPLALPGRPVAREDFIRRMWGTEESNREKLEELRLEVRSTLGRIGVTPDSDYYVEQDRVGFAGKKGVTLETRRYHLTAEFLKGLTGE